MSKKNRKNNRRQNNVQDVQIDPFQQYLFENYGNVVNEAYVRYTQQLANEQLFADMDTIRNEWEIADAAAAAAVQAKAAEAARNAKAAKIAAEAARREADRRNSIATLKARVTFVGLCSVPMILAVVSLVSQINQTH